MDRDTGRPQWVVEVLAQDNERGEVIRVTVTGDQPKVTPGQPVRFDALEAIAWNNNGKAGVAYRAAAIHPLSPPAPPSPGAACRRSRVSRDRCLRRLSCA